MIVHAALMFFGINLPSLLDLSVIITLNCYENKTKFGIMVICVYGVEKGGVFYRLADGGRLSESGFTGFENFQDY